MVSIPWHTFSGGEVSEGLLSRVGDVQRVAGGVARLQNWLVGRDGVVYTRPGSRFCGATAEGALRIEEFVFNEDQSYVLEIGAGYIRIWTQGALLLTGAQSNWSDATAYVAGDIAVGTTGGTTGKFYYCTAPHTSSDGDNGPHDANGLDLFWYELPDYESSSILEVPTPYTADEVPLLHFDQSGDVLTVCSTGHPPHEFSRLGASAWTCLPMKIAPSAVGPTGIQLGSATGNGSGLTRKIRYAVTALFPDDTESSAGVNATTASGGQLTVTAGQDISVFDGSHGLETGDQIVIAAVTFLSAATTHVNAVIALQGLTFTVDVTDSDNFTLRDTADLYEDPVQGAGAPTTFVTYGQSHLETTKKVPANVAAGDDIEVTWTAVAGAERYYIYRSVEDGPFGFLGETKGLVFRDIGDIDPDDGFTLPIYENPFKGDSRPASSAFFQQRQVFAGSTGFPLRVWFSVLGDLRNFSARSSINDADSFYVDIDGSPGQGIVGLDIHGELIARTTEQVYLVQGDQDGSFTPITTRARPIARSGSSTAESQRVGDSLVFVQRHGRVLRQIRYDVATGGLDGYAGRDVTLYASHLFLGRTVKWTAYAESPNSTLWVGYTNGAVSALTHVNEAQIEAWSRHSFGGTDTVLWGAAIPEGGEDVLYVLVQRDGAKYLERLASWGATSDGYDPVCDSVFLDSCLIYDGRNTGATTLEVGQDMPLTDPPTGLGFTSSPGIFTAGSVDEEFKVTLADGVEYRFLVTGYVSATAVNVTAVGDTPAQSLLGATTTTWTRMVSDFTGADHLEGRTVGIFGDGTDAGTDTVASGEVSTSVNYGCVVVGLPIDSLIETLDPDIANQLNGVGVVKKKANVTTLYVAAARRLSVGMKGSTLDEMKPTEDDGPVYDVNGTDLYTGKVRVSHGARYSASGRIQIRQDHPLPGAVGGMVPDYDFGGQ